MAVDAPTSSFYARAAAEYAAAPPHGAFVQRRNHFVRLLPSDAHILDLGCGGGHDSRAFKDLGFDVTAVDGSAEMAAIASRRIDENVIVCIFQDFDLRNEFDGVWASASLLHVPSAELQDVLERVQRCLKLGGLLCASFKEADEDWRDGNGRLFCAMTETALRKHLEGVGFQVESVERHKGYGSDSMPTNWLWALARSAGVSIP
jgi:SAM-dependent methyltransferase